MTKMMRRTRNFTTIRGYKTKQIKMAKLKPEVLLRISKLSEAVEMDMLLKDPVFKNSNHFQKALYKSIVKMRHKRYRNLEHS